MKSLLDLFDGGLSWLLMAVVGALLAVFASGCQAGVAGNAGALGYETVSEIHPEYAEWGVAKVDNGARFDLGYLSSTWRGWVGEQPEWWTGPTINVGPLRPRSEKR